jgi:hypothetical protein
VEGEARGVAGEPGDDLRMLVGRVEEADELLMARDYSEQRPQASCSSESSISNRWYLRLRLQALPGSYYPDVQGPDSIKLII